MFNALGFFTNCYNKYICILLHVTYGMLPFIPKITSSKLSLHTSKCTINPQTRSRPLDLGCLGQAYITLQQHPEQSREALVHWPLPSSSFYTPRAAAGCRGFRCQGTAFVFLRFCFSQRIFLSCTSMRHAPVMSTPPPNSGGS